MSLAKVEKVADADFPTRWGHFRILGFRGTMENSAEEDAVAVVMGDVVASTPLVRIHSQCLTGDVFGSLRCDCRDQLEMALEMIADAGTGILLYEQKEGRGIGLLPKLKAYELQDSGLDTVEANEQLGFAADEREYELPAAILRLMGVTQVRLLSNNPRKVEALEAGGIRVVERVSAEVAPRASFENYMRVKKEKMGHLLS
jgi:GTP cyclohydrolase II